MPYFFYGAKIIHSFSPETKKTTPNIVGWPPDKSHTDILCRCFYSLSIGENRIRNRPPPRFAKIVLCLFEIIDQKLRLIPGTFF